MKKVTFLLVAILVLGVSNIVKAQDTKAASHAVGFTVPNFAILDIESTAEGGNDITLILTEAKLEAGNEFNFAAASNSSLWLNYTALAEAGKTREVTVSTSEVIPGIDLKLQVAEDAKKGKGALGKAIEGEVVLTKSAKTIISNIGSCYTGDGNASGHNLTYTMAANDYSVIEAGDKSVTVYYTIADAE